MYVKTKKESIEKIKELKLNHFKEEVFGINDFERIKLFFLQNPAKEYCLRDGKNTSGKFFFVSSYEECLQKLIEYKGFITLCVSANEYDDNIILLGDIKVKKGFETDIVDLTARTDKNADHRNIYEEPEYNIHTTLDDDKIWDIPGFSKIISYIAKYELYDVVVEFAVYDCPVGINNENVAIFELRSDY